MEGENRTSIASAGDTFALEISLAKQSEEATKPAISTDEPPTTSRETITTSGASSARNTGQDELNRARIANRVDLDYQTGCIANEDIDTHVDVVASSNVTRKGGDIGSFEPSDPGGTRTPVQTGATFKSRSKTYETEVREEQKEQQQMKAERSTKASSGSHEGSYDELQKALIGFYGVHNPEKIATLDAILAQYRGKEDVLFERLEQKYSADLSYARRAIGKVTPIASTMVSFSKTETEEATGIDIPNIHSESQPLSSEVQGIPATPNLTGKSSARQAGAVSGSHGITSTVTGTATVPMSRSNARTSSSSYMTYLADQIRVNVEGFLPGTSGGIASSPTVPSSMPPSATSPPSSAAQWQRKGPRAILPSTSSATAGLSDAKYWKMEGRAGMPIGGTESSNARHVSMHPHTTLGAGQFAVAGTSAMKNQVEVFQGSVKELRGQGLEDALNAERERADAALDRVRLLEEERVGLLARCKRLQGKADAASREAAAAEELREAGQRKISAFAERAAATERQAREAAMRVRALESRQAALQVEKEASIRRCAAKHKQLLSAIDLQMALRSQLEGLLEVVPLPVSTKLQSSGARGRIEGDDLPTSESLGASDSASINVISVTNDSKMSTNIPMRDGSIKGTTCNTGTNGISSDTSRGSDGGGENSSNGFDEINRRCSMLEVAFKASRRECSYALQTRDAAEDMVRTQRSTLISLQAKVSDLEERFIREVEAGKVAAQAALTLETELGLRLDQLQVAESKLSEQTEGNARLREDLRGAAARLKTASAARAALLGFCRQERTAVEQEAAEHVTRVEENASMRGEEGLAQGLELVRMAEEACEKKAAAAAEEADRLGKALFTARAELASSEAREQALRRELDRAAETIAGLGTTASPILAKEAMGVVSLVDGARENIASGIERALRNQELPGAVPSARRRTDEMRSSVKQGEHDIEL